MLPRSIVCPPTTHTRYTHTSTALHSSRNCAYKPANTHLAADADEQQPLDLGRERLDGRQDLEARR